MIRLKDLLIEAVNPAIKKMYPKYSKLLRKKGYYVGPDGTGMAHIVVDKNGRRIAGPSGSIEIAVWNAAHQVGIISNADKETVKKYRWR